MSVEAKLTGHRMNNLVKQRLTLKQHRKAYTLYYSECGF